MRKSEIKQIPEKEAKLAADCLQRFKDAMLAKAPFTERWLEYLNAWDNSLYEKHNGPSYKTNHVSNFIYSTIESMRPILFDHNPKFEAIPVTADGMQYANDINSILDWEWHRTGMQRLLLANSIYTFVIGTSIVMLNYEYDKNPKSEVDGNVKPIAVSPFNFYPDPLATSIEDAEYCIYAQYVHVAQLKQKYPKKADFLSGSDIQYSELVNDRDENAKINNQVLVLEMYCRDYSLEEFEDEDGEKKKRAKYPNGKLIICAPECGVILEEKPNPYDTGRFPFFIFKDIDVPFQFWGEGEVKWLLSPQKNVNDLYNQIIDNAKATANMQWVIDKNAGIPKGELTNRPGLIIRKNPGSEVRRDSPPSMPMYVQQMIETLKMDIEVVSGVHDVTRGQTPSGIQSGAAITALQEAAQTRVRLKQKLHENTVGEIGTEWLERIKQFWKFNRLVPKELDESSQLPKMSAVGTEIQPMMQMGQPTGKYQMLSIEPERQLNHDYIIKIIGTSVMQSNRASMLDQMIRLMQTPAEDGMPCVPREAVLDYLPDVNKRVVMQYFQKLKEEQAAKEQVQNANNEMMMQMQQLSQQLQQVSGVVGQLQQRQEQRDVQEREDDVRYQGYQQGMAEAQALQKQIDKSGKLPPELLEEIANMSDEELGLLLQQHPEIVEMLESNENNR